MPRVKGRRTQDALVQFRLAERDKAVLEKYAQAQGMTLSELLRMTAKNLVKVVEGSKTS